MSAHTDFSYLRSQISRKEDYVKLENIEKDRQKVRIQNKILTDNRFIDIQLGELLFYFRKDLAPASVDTYIEIFRDKAHMKLPPFKPLNCTSVLDIGANEGFYSIYMKQKNPHLRILSVEPVPSAFEILQRNLKANGFHDIQTINLAVGDRNQTVEMEVYPHVSSISAENMELLQRPWIHPDRINKIKVPMKTLSSLFYEYNLGTVDVLKLDVEGSEMKILQTSKRVLKRVRKLVVEWHTPELREKCKRFLRNRNFKLLHEERRRIGDSYFINEEI
ncbi:FkbM family methyltransferase [bacterium]|nr:FkbM family methyltransferase [bacterium]